MTINIYALSVKMDSQWSTIINMTTVNQRVIPTLHIKRQMQGRYLYLSGRQSSCIVILFKQSTWSVGLAACRTEALDASGQDTDISSTVKVFYSFHYNNSETELLQTVYISWRYWLDMCQCRPSHLYWHYI